MAGPFRFVGHQYGGFPIREVGAYYGMRRDQISRFRWKSWRKVLEREKLEKVVTGVVTKVNPLDVENSLLDTLL